LHRRLTRSREGVGVLFHAETLRSPREQTDPARCWVLAPTAAINRIAVVAPPPRLEGDGNLPTNTSGKTGSSDAFRSASSVPRREKSLHSKNPHAKTRGWAGVTELFHAETPRSPRGTLLNPPCDA
jgi:hypothetical protein